jgi:hypothetical protein
MQAGVSYSFFPATVTPGSCQALHAAEEPPGDAFDAVVGLFGMLEVVLGRREPGELTDEQIRNVEGWILGRQNGLVVGARASHNDFQVGAGCFQAGH